MCRAAASHRAIQRLRSHALPALLRAAKPTVWYGVLRLLHLLLRAVLLYRVARWLETVHRVAQQLLLLRIRLVVQQRLRRRKLLLMAFFLNRVNLDVSRR